MTLPFDGGQSLAWLYLDEQYTPATVNRVLHTVAGYYRLGFWRPEKLAVALRMGGHCLCSPSSRSGAVAPVPASRLASHRTG